VGPGACVYLTTLTLPDFVPEEAFAQGMTLVEDELRTMKRVLEGAS
jgi:hypothetical protein